MPAERGITFQATGNITIVLHWNARSINNTNIGAGGLHPPYPGAGQPITFTLSPDDPERRRHQAAYRIRPNSVYVGYFPNTQTWQLINASGGVTAGADGEWSYVYAYITSTGTVSNLAVQGLTAGDLPRVPALLENPTGAPQYTNKASTSGFTTAIPCNSAVAADFDNDMDEDLYLVCRNAVSNAQDMLYENNGAGVFTAVSGAGGAPGPVGYGSEPAIPSSPRTTTWTASSTCSRPTALPCFRSTVFHRRPGQAIYEHGGGEPLQPLDRAGLQRHHVEPRRHRVDRHRDGGLQAAAEGAQWRQPPLVQE
jgi:hypothetical protein